MNNGGSAFPNEEVRGPDGAGIREGSYGMSLRDYFAARAIPRLIGYNTQMMIGVSGWQEHVAWAAYSVADAMLREQQKQGGQ